MQARSAIAHLQRSHLPVLQLQVVMSVSKSTEDKTDNQQGIYPVFHQIPIPILLVLGAANLIDTLAIYCLLGNTIFEYAMTKLLCLVAIFVDHHL